MGSDFSDDTREFPNLEKMQKSEIRRTTGKQL